MVNRLSSKSSHHYLPTHSPPSPQHTFGLLLPNSSFIFNSFVYTFHTWGNFRKPTLLPLCNFPTIFQFSSHKIETKQKTRTKKDTLCTTHPVSFLRTFQLSSTFLPLHPLSVLGLFLHRYPCVSVFSIETDPSSRGVWNSCLFSPPSLPTMSFPHVMPL